MSYVIFQMTYGIAPDKLLFGNEAAVSNQLSLKEIGLSRKVQTIHVDSISM